MRRALAFISLFPFFRCGAIGSLTLITVDRTLNCESKQALPQGALSGKCKKVASTVGVCFLFP